MPSSIAIHATRSTGHHLASSREAYNNNNNAYSVRYHYVCSPYNKTSFDQENFYRTRKLAPRRHCIGGRTVYPVVHVGHNTRYYNIKRCYRYTGQYIKGGSSRDRPLYDLNGSSNYDLYVCFMLLRISTKKKIIIKTIFPSKYNREHAHTHRHKHPGKTVTSRKYTWW